MWHVLTDFRLDVLRQRILRNTSLLYSDLTKFGRKWYLQKGRRGEMVELGHWVQNQVFLARHLQGRNIIINTLNGSACWKAGSFSPACLSVRLPACMSVCLSVLPVCLSEIKSLPPPPHSNTKPPLLNKRHCNWGGGGGGEETLFQTVCPLLSPETGSAV